MRLWGKLHKRRREVTGVRVRAQVCVRARSLAWLEGDAWDEGDGKDDSEELRHRGPELYPEGFWEQ